VRQITDDVGQGASATPFPAPFEWPTARMVRADRIGGIVMLLLAVAPLVPGVV